MSNQSGSGERAESLGVRRSVELPEADIDAAGDLAPADGSGSVEENDASADEAEDEAVGLSSGEGEGEGDGKGESESEKAAVPKDGTEAASKKEHAATAHDIAVATPPADGDGDGDGMPPDRPKKPVLAAVAIGGAVVLAIPILLIGTGSHDGKKHRSAAAADTVLPGDGQQPPPGAFVSTSPTTTPSASASKKGKAKASKKATPTPSAKPSASSRVRSQSVSNERPLSSAPRSRVLHAPYDIYPGKTVRTSRIAMTMQSGGNLVLRDKSNKIIWSTGTHRRGVYAEFQTDGNLVLYAGDRQAVWAAGSFGHDKSTMVFQSDYNVVIIDHGGHPVWATGTNR
jgi:hypothetical protein